MALCLLRDVAKGLFMYNFNVKVFFELTHLTIQVIVTAIVSTFFQFINLYFSDEETKFRIVSGTARSYVYYLDALDNQARATAMMYATGWME